MTEKKPAATKSQATAKEPQDRLPKKPSVKEVEGGKEVTLNGIKVVIKDAAFRDHRVMQKLAKLRKGDLPMVEKIILNGEMIDRVLGEEQAEKLISALADADGYTDIMALSQTFNELVGAAYPNS